MKTLTEIKDLIALAFQDLLSRLEKKLAIIEIPFNVNRYLVYVGETKGSLINGRTVLEFDAPIFQDNSIVGYRFRPINDGKKEFFYFECRAEFWMSYVSQDSRFYDNGQIYDQDGNHTGGA